LVVGDADCTLAGVGFSTLCLEKPCSKNFLVFFGMHGIAEKMRSRTIGILSVLSGLLACVWMVLSVLWDLQATL
jgi:hypothetical protein